MLVSDRYLIKNSHYHEDLLGFFRYSIPENSRVLEIGSGTGYLLAGLNPSYGVGIDVSEEKTDFARSKYPSANLHFITSEGEDLNIEDKFDYIIISDTLAMVGDIQKIFHNLKKVCTDDTRIVISTYNILWEPFLRLAEMLKIKSPSPDDNWLTVKDLESLLYIEDFQVIKSGRRFLFPFKIPYITRFINKYIAMLPLFNQLCLVETIIARPFRQTEKSRSVSIVIPARNEEGNIEEIVRRIPDLGVYTEIIFVEGGSSDNTENKIREVVIKNMGNRNIKLLKQSGEGKADAVRLGFEKATGEILMILDADLTVPPEDLERFYNVIKSNKGEFVYGSRLVYAMQAGAMQMLNILGNKFFSVVFTYLLDTPIKDTLCGTKVISKNNYQKLVSNRLYFGDFDPFGDFDLIFGAAKLNLKFVEIPVRYKARVYGSTNISRFRNGLQLLDMVIFCMKKIKFI